MTKKLDNYKVAILVADGFEESELAKPKKALEDAGAIVHIISPERGSVRAWKDDAWSGNYTVDVHIDDAQASKYNALLLPGGVINPDKLRLSAKAILFIKEFGKAGKPIASICHGPWTLIDAELIKGKTVTSWPSIRKDLENAGAQWVDQEVVVDDTLLTSRKPDDIPAFNQAMILLFSKSLIK